MGHEIPYMTLVLLTGLAAAAVAIRRRVLFRMAVRNAGRRKVQVALAIAGLLVATSILSGSFVVGAPPAAGPLHPDEQLSEARANLIGLTPALDPGTFVRSDGTGADGSALSGNRTYVNEELAPAAQPRAGARPPPHLG